MKEHSKIVLITGADGFIGSRLVELLVKKGYNAYLKANKQDKGVESYNYVVDLFISHFEKTLKH